MNIYLLMLSWVNAVSIVVVMKRMPTNILIPASILVVYFRFWLKKKIVMFSAKIKIDMPWNSAK